jgi:hypothetical protein
MAGPVLPNQRPPRRPLGVLRGLAAMVGVLIMLISGGCALVFGAGSLGGMRMALDYATLPFLIGFAIFGLAVWVGR